MNHSKLIVVLSTGSILGNNIWSTLPAIRICILLLMMLNIWSGIQTGLLNTLHGVR